MARRTDGRTEPLVRRFLTELDADEHDPFGACVFFHLGTSTSVVPVACCVAFERRDVADVGVVVADAVDVADDVLVTLVPLELEKTRNTNITFQSSHYLCNRTFFVVARYQTII